MRWLQLSAAVILLLAAPALARVGDPVAVFERGPLLQQLRLSPSGQTAAGGGIVTRYVSDDQAITVDLVVRGGVIEQEIMYLPMDLQRGIHVTFFLQDAVGSVVGAQKGMLGFTPAVRNRSETFMTFGGYTMRFTPMGGLLRVLVSR